MGYAYALIYGAATIAGVSLLSAVVRAYLARVAADGGTSVDDAHAEEVYTDTVTYNPLLIESCESGKATVLYTLFAFQDINTLQARVTADSGTNADVGQNAKVAQHLWRNDLHNSASIVVTCASIKAGKLYGYQPTVEPDTTLLDYYTGSAAAYSLRSLSTSTTNVVKVRRSGDDAELDFTASEVSDGTLEAWVVAGGGTEDGFVTTWYDQSGNGNNATQATAANQPKIVSSGTLVTENGKAALDFDGINDKLALADGALPSNINNVSAFTVQTNGTGISLQLGSNDPNNRFYLLYNDDFGYGNNAALITSIASAGTQYIISAIAGSTQGNVQPFINGVSAGSTALQSATPNSGTGFISGAVNFNSKFQEAIIYHSDQSANRTGIEANINAHYNIYP